MDQPEFAVLSRGRTLFGVLSPPRSRRRDGRAIVSVLLVLGHILLLVEKMRGDDLMRVFRESSVSSHCRYGNVSVGRCREYGEEILPALGWPSYTQCSRPRCPKAHWARRRPRFSHSRTPKVAPRLPQDPTLYQRANRASDTISSQKRPFTL